MDQGSLFPQAEAGRHSQHQSDGLDHQGPLAQVAPDDEPTQDGLDLCGERGGTRGVRRDTVCVCV